MHQRTAPPRKRVLVMSLASAVAAFTSQYARAENPAEVLELPSIEVVGTTPLPGIGTPLKEVPANVQMYQGKDLEKQRQPNVTDYLEQNPTSITVNAAQGNPFQPDISFRGFTASPLLGLPQGLSVFQDGVRINEPFGDVVNWDLIPQSAISSIQIVPGSNPAFGLNTLGGALAVYTKSGTQYPGGSITASGGSFGRKAVEFEQGGQQGNLDYFVTGNYFDDHGWAEHNPSRVKQFFGKVGYQNDKTDIDLSLTLADNTLQGTQTLPQSWLNTPRQAYTFPDINQNQATFLALKGSHFLTDDVLIGGNAYYRKYKNSSLASNVNGDFDPVTNPVEATNDRSTIDQDSYGLGAQVTFLGTLGTRKNQLAVGASGDFGDTRFKQEFQQASFAATRDTVGSGSFALDTDVKSDLSNYGLYATDTVTLSDRWSVTVSGRYNRAQVKIADQTGTSPALNGDNTFSRFNPAVGVTFNPNKDLTAYLTYNEGMRAPTPVELTCADPNAPCKLPNNFLSDPPLKKVVAKTIETGARGTWGGYSWSGALYRTDLQDDIQFLSSGAGATNAGYFQNVGATRRQGVEFGVGNKFGPLAVTLRYSYIDATYLDGFSESSPTNSTADANGTIQVRPGNHVPGIPQHTLKLRLEYDVTEKWSTAINTLTTSSIYARGDENNQDANGKVAGYTTVNFETRYKASKAIELFARANNLLDRHYANFGILGRNFFTGPNRTFDGNNPVLERFLGLGAPRGIWVGLRYAWE